MSSTSQPFSYLRAKLQEWNAGDLLPPRKEQSWERFQEVAAAHLTPIVEELRQVLGEEEIPVTLRELCEETRCVGLSIDDHDIELFFAPGQDPRAFQFNARRTSASSDGYHRRIPYHQLDRGRVTDLVEELLLRLLGPRRATKNVTTECPITENPQRAW